MPRAPTPVKRYHETLIQTMRDIGQHQKWFTSPLNLGGVTGPGGGSGIPIGGLIGQLIQSKVAYDTTEAATSYTPPSGRSLLDNLNHIRYLITQGGIGGSGILVAVSENDTTPNYLENKLTAGSSKIAVTTANEGANEERQVDLGTVNLNDLNGVTITTVGNDEVLGYDAGGWLNRTLTEAGVSAVGHTHVEANITDLAHEITVQEDDVETASDVTTLNFEGAVITLDEGSGKVTITISGVSGSGIAGIDIEEAGTPKVTDATILNFVSGATIVDAGGGQADITVSGGGGGGAADASVWMPDCPPATAYSSGGVDDDEFDDASLDTGIWTIFDEPDTQTETESEYGLNLSTTSTNKFQGIFQPVPAGSDWSFTTYVGQHHNQVNDELAGILLLSDIGNLATSDVFIFGTFRGGAGYGWRWAKASDFNGTGYSDGSWINDSKDFHYYIRLRTNGTTWYFDISSDGYNWVHSAYTQAEEFTPAGIGVGHRINNTAWSANYKFARFKDDSSYDQMLYGDRVNMWRT